MSASALPPTTPEQWAEWFGSPCTIRLLSRVQEMVSHQRARLAAERASYESAFPIRVDQAMAAAAEGAEAAGTIAGLEHVMAAIDATRTANPAALPTDDDPTWGLTRCKGCSRPLYLRNVYVADGCPCNTPRGVNHGIVPAFVCTCVVCDPARTGSSRAPAPMPVPEQLAPTPPAPGVVTDPDKVDTTIGPDGQQASYLVLSENERVKGFVRPVRLTYQHVGTPAPVHPLRDLTPEEAERYAAAQYVKFEAYPPSPDGSSVIGRYWTQEQLDKAGKGCGTITKMSLTIAETYARSPDFYSGTFCVSCRKHLPVGAFGEFIWDDGSGQRVGT